MKVLIFNLLFSIVGLQLIAQEFAPIGAEWYYDERFAFSGDIDYIRFTSEKDTLIFGKNCKKITKRHKLTCNDRPTIEYIYTRNDTVFFLDTLFDEFQILYVFDANQGDSWSIKIKDEHQNIDTINVLVDSIASTNINGIDLHTLYVTYHRQPEDTSLRDYSSVIIERIGDIKYMFNWNSWKDIVCDANITQGLRCYQDTTIGLYSTGIADSCDYTYDWTGIEKVENNSFFKLYPNPASQYITFETTSEDKFLLEILNINGEIVYSKQIISNERIEPKINSGIYLFRIKKGNKLIKTKKIIINNAL